MKIIDYSHEYTYDSVKGVSDQMCESNDCAVIAVSLVARRPYDEVRQLFSDAGRRHRGRTKDEYTFKVLKTIGLHLMELPSVPQTVKQCEYDLRFTNSYLIWTSGHILAMINGVVQDWTNGRRHRPIKVCAVS